MLAFQYGFQNNKCDFEPHTDFFEWKEKKHLSVLNAWIKENVNSSEKKY